jgi:hypothetical protein
MLIRVIYTPETDHFRLNGSGLYLGHKPGDPVISTLKETYQKLGRSIDLPSSVGIVTTNDIFKLESRKIYTELIDDGDLKIDSTYIPLCILEAALKCKDENYEENEVYRTLMFLMSKHVFLDKCIPGHLSRSFPFLSCTSAVNKVIGGLIENLEGFHNEDHSELIGEYRFYLEDFPQLDVLNETYDYFRERFEANQVLRDFPLYFLILGYSFPSLYSVSLVEEIEEHPVFEDFFDFERMGPDITKEYKGAIEELEAKFRKDKFGKTSQVRSGLVDLLEELPEPKTILTDIYIGDHFPELRALDFEATNFSLD